MLITIHLFLERLMTVLNTWLSTTNHHFLSHHHSGSYFRSISKTAKSISQDRCNCQDFHDITIMAKNLVMSHLSPYKNHLSTPFALQLGLVSSTLEDRSTDTVRKVCDSGRGRQRPLQLRRTVAQPRSPRNGDFSWTTNNQTAEMDGYDGCF